MSNYKSQTAIANARDYDNSFTAEYDTNQTNTTIITPTSGTRLAVKGVYITTEATTGYCRLEFGTSANTVHTTFANAQPGYVPVDIKGARNEVLRMDSSLGADNNFFIQVNYREE